MLQGNLQILRPKPNAGLLGGNDSLLLILAYQSSKRCLRALRSKWAKAAIIVGGPF